MIDQNKKISVLIVDDSKLIRNLFEQILSSDPHIRVVGKAPDPYVARDLIKRLNPDVITLDIIMPHMDGLTFLKNLMRLHPLPVVMISTLTEQGSAIGLEALASGAVDYLPKPSAKELENSDEYGKKLIQAVKNASSTNVSAILNPHIENKRLEDLVYHADFLRSRIIAIGGSTGGIEAIESILVQLPKTVPGILITQHIRQDFVSHFAKRINKLCRLTVEEATNHAEIVPGKVYIASSGYHLTVIKNERCFYCKLDEGPPVNSHKPSIDVLFQSVAENLNDHAIAVLLTGMGEDGAKGAKAIHDRGGTVIVQDKETSVVWGMPGAAVALNAADHVVPLPQIPQTIFQVLDTMSQKQR